MNWTEFTKFLSSFHGDFLGLHHWEHGWDPNRYGLEIALDSLFSFSIQPELKQKGNQKGLKRNLHATAFPRNSIIIKVQPILKAKYLSPNVIGSFYQSKTKTYLKPRHINHNFCLRMPKPAMSADSLFSSVNH